MYAIYIEVGWTFRLLEGLPTSLTRENLSKLTTKLLVSFWSKIKKAKLINIWYVRLSSHCGQKFAMGQ